MLRLVKESIIKGLAVFIILSGCATFSSLLSSKQTSTQRLYSSESVKIYQEESLLPDSYKIVGKIRAETPIFVQYNEAYSKLEKFLKIEAHKLGADGIVNIETYEMVNPEVSRIDRQFNSILQGKGDAIVILKNEKKVELLDEELQTLEEGSNSTKKGEKKGNWSRFVEWIGSLFGR